MSGTEHVKRQSVTYLHIVAINFGMFVLFINTQSANRTWDQMQNQ